MSYTPLPIQVLVMSYTTFRIHQKLVYSKGIDMLIVDEAELATKGRWGGQPEPSRWRPAWGRKDRP